LQEFYAEQEALRELLEKSTVSDPNDNAPAAGGSDEQLGSGKTELFNNDLNKTFPEDWQLSQFWYDEKTSKTLANEVLRQAQKGKIACLSCPSIFRACENAENVHLFEYDRRFQAFGSLFHFYDYSDPENIPNTLATQPFPVVMCNLIPPFLPKRCLGQKSYATMTHLVKYALSCLVGWENYSFGDRLD
ncbi:Protein-lysine N-methyltransferase N6AMT2, partial [Orchesella cincta]